MGPILPAVQLKDSPTKRTFLEFLWTISMQFAENKECQISVDLSITDEPGCPKNHLEHSVLEDWI